jgi:dihydropyrimidinase
MFDTIFRGATLVSEQTGELRADIAVKDGRIAAIVEAGAAVDSAQTIDVKGLHILPGVIDPHVHIGHGSPHDEDFFTESRSAAVGGVTTFLTYFRKEPYDYDRLLPALIADGNANSIIDFGVHLVVFTDDHLKSVPQYVSAGVTSFKFFLGHQDSSLREITAIPHIGGHLPVDDAFILKGFRALGQIPGTLAVAHCENAEINQAARKQAIAAGLTGLKAWSASRPDFSETEGIRRAVYWAELAQVPLYVVHVGSARSARELVRLRQSSAATIYAETLVQYLTLTADAPVGILAKMNPPLRTESDQDGLWAAVARGQFDTIASDHGAFKRAEKPDVWTGRTGTPSSGLIVAGLLHGGYRTGRLSLVDIVRLTSAGPARVFGLAGRKGTLRPGADADFTIADLKLTREPTPEFMQSRSDFSTFEGLRLTGWPRLTVSRGEVVVEDGQVLGARGRGEYLHRPLASRDG